MAVSDAIAQLTQIENAQALSKSVRERCAKLGVAVPAELDDIDARLAGDKATVTSSVAAQEVATVAK